MGVYKYTGVKGTGYGVDYALKGKRIRERVGSNKKEAAEYLGKKLKEIWDGKYREGPERVVLFEELAADYEKQTKGKKSFHNEEYYIKTLLEHFTGKTLSELTVREIELFQTERKESPTRAKKTRSGATVNREMATLGAMLNEAVKWEMILKNPASKVKAFAESSRRNCFLSVDEAGRLIDACGQHLRPIVVTALETGMRRAEILGLRWKEIKEVEIKEKDDEGREVKVKIKVIYLAEERTKNGKPREVPISNTLEKELERLKSAYSGGRVVELTGLVFQAPRERKGFRSGVLQVVTGPMRDIRGAWESAKAKAGIPADFRFHDLRHTFASHQKLAGTDDYTLMEIMGHSDHRMMRRYAHLTPEHKRKAVNSLPKWKVCQKSVINLELEKEGVRSTVPQLLEVAGV